MGNQEAVLAAGDRSLLAGDCFVESAGGLFEVGDSQAKEVGFRGWFLRVFGLMDFSISRLLLRTYTFDGSFFVLQCLQSCDS